MKNIPDSVTGVAAGTDEDIQPRPIVNIFFDFFKKNFRSLLVQFSSIFPTAGYAPMLILRASQSMLMSYTSTPPDYKPREAALLTQDATAHAVQQGKTKRRAVRERPPETVPQPWSAARGFRTQSSALG